MTICPKCGHQTVRLQVSLYVDIPGKLMHRLTKRARSREVRIDGAGWPTAQHYCTRASCAWTMRAKPGRRS